MPNLVNLLTEVERAGPKYPVSEGEGRLTIRLTDAGERACDPDRVARTIDGIDMLYSACASIARKPAMDLRLEAVDGKTNRNLHFTGERDSISAVIAVIESIPYALEEIDAEQDFELDELVTSLPVFEDLKTLASLGTFSDTDLKDISETMHQGALLALESGVILVSHSPVPDAAVARPKSVATPASADNASLGQ